MTVKLDDRILRKLVKKLGSKLAAKTVKVGILSDEPHPDGTVGMVELAAIHEFGSPAAGIPARSFIASPFKRSDNMKEQAKISGKIAAGILTNRLSIDSGLEILGTWGANTIKKNMKDGKIKPDIKPATKAKKGSTKPLVDKGHLINAVTHKVGK